MAKAKANIFAAPTADGNAIKRMSEAYTADSKSLHFKLAVYAASCIMHAVQHGQVTPALRMIEDMGDGMRRDSMVKWLIAFGPFALIEKEEKDATGKKQKGKTLGFDANKNKALKAKLKKNAIKFGGELVKLPFYKWEKPSDPFKGLDLEARIKALLKQAEGVAKDEVKSKHPDNNLDWLPGLRSFIKGGGKLEAHTVH